MSLFGSLTGDFEDDPFFIGAHMQSMQHMNSMMNSMFADPFGMMGPPALMGAPNQQNRQPQMPGMQMMPFGFPPMPMIGRMFSGLDNMSQNPNCHSFTSSSVMTMTSGPDGRPQVYQESMSTRTGPGGIKETKKSVSDSMSGKRSLAVGHHIGERAHIIEREQNVRTGDQEERQDFINLDEEEAETFNHEWESKARRSVGAIANSSYRPSYSRAQDNRPLALPSTAPSPSQQNKNQSRILAAPRRAIKSALSPKKNKKPSSGSAESTTTSNSANSSSSSPSNSAPKDATVTRPSSSESPQNLSNHSSRNNNNNNNNDDTSSSHNSSSSNSHNNSSSPASRKRERSPDPEDDEAGGNNKRRSQGDAV